MSLMDYIKNRRLALANRDLLGGEKVTETAFRYGYETVEGFSRAFRDLVRLSAFRNQQIVPAVFLIDMRTLRMASSRTAPDVLGFTELFAGHRVDFA